MFQLLFRWSRAASAVGEILAFWLFRGVWAVSRVLALHSRAVVIILISPRAVLAVRCSCGRCGSVQASAEVSSKATKRVSRGQLPTHSGSVLEGLIQQATLSPFLHSSQSRAQSRNNLFTTLSSFSSATFANPGATLFDATHVRPWMTFVRIEDRIQPVEPTLRVPKILSQSFRF